MDDYQEHMAGIGHAQTAAAAHKPFTLEDRIVYHTYFTYAHGLDGLWGMYEWLDPLPKAAMRRRLVAPP